MLSRSFEIPSLVLSVYSETPSLVRKLSGRVPADRWHVVGKYSLRCNLMSCGLGYCDSGRIAGSGRIAEAALILPQQNYVLFFSTLPQW